MSFDTPATDPTHTHTGTHTGTGIHTGTGLDVDALLAGVYRRHRRHQRRRLVGSGIGVMAAGVLAVALTTGGGPSSPSPASPGDSARGGSASGDEVVALTPYTVSAARDATPVAVVDGLELTFLPAGLPTEPTLVEEGTNASGQATFFACFGRPDCAGDSLGVSVTRSPGLDLAGYLETHWVNAPTETTVGGLPALASGVASDEAAGLVWSPQPGVVIEINIDSDMAADLRSVVDGARFTG